MWRLLAWLYSFAPPTKLQLDIIDHLLDDRSPGADGFEGPWVTTDVGTADTIIAGLLKLPRREPR